MPKDKKEEQNKKDKLKKSRNKFWIYFLIVKLGIWIMITGLFIYFFRLYFY
jgi:nitrate reductase NapE component